MADERGIEQTKELLDFIFSLIGAIKESTKDGEFTWSDGLNFIEPLKKIAPAIDDIEEVIPEIMDLDASEWNELVDYVQANFDLDTDPEDDTDIETKIEEALNAGVELLRLTQVIKEGHGRRASRCQAPSRPVTKRG